MTEYEKLLSKTKVNSSAGVGISQENVNKRNKAQTAKSTVAKTKTVPTIKALGASDYGAGKDHVVKAGAYSTASSLANIRGQLLAPTGDLTMGQSAQAAIKGVSQSSAEKEKYNRQAVTQKKAYGAADSLAQRSAEEVAKAKAGKSKFGQTMVDVGVAGTQMLGDLALNAIVPGSGLAAMGARAYGSSSLEARQAGANALQQVGYGLASAGVEVLTEKMFDGLAGLYGGGTFDKALEKAIGKLAKSDAGKTALRVLANASGEGIEEIASDIANPIIRSIYNNKSVVQNYSEEKLSDWLHDGLVGGILGAVGGGTQIINGKNAQLNKESRINNGYASEKTMTPQEQAAHDKVLALNPQPTKQTAAPDVVKILAGTNIQPETTEQATAQDGARNVITPPQEQDAPQSAQQAVAGQNETSSNYSQKTYSELQSEIDNYTDELIEKYGQDEVLIVDPKTKFNYITMKPAILTDAELTKLSSLYGQRDAIAENEKTSTIDGVLNLIPDTDFSKEGFFASREAIKSTLEEIYHNNELIKAFHNKPQEISKEQIYNILVKKTNIPNELWGEYDFAKAIADNSNPLSNPFGRSTAPIIKQVEDISNAMTGTVQNADSKSTNYIQSSSDAEDEWNSIMSQEPQSDGLGAADKGFATTPYTEWQNATDEGGFHPISDTAAQNVVEQQSRAPMEIPKQDVNGGLTSKQVSTIVNSGITPDDFASALANDAATGKFSHMAYSDAEAVHKAEQTILGKSWDVAYTEYKDAVKDGKVSKDITASGIVLYNNAVTSGDYAKAMDIASTMIGNSTNVGQAMQAMNLLNKLSPEGKLYMAQKAVDDINERVKTANENTPKTRKARKQSQDAADATEDAIAEAAGAIAKGITRKGGSRKAKTTIDGNMAGEPFTFEYVDQIGEAVGRAVKARATSKPKAKTFADNIISELKAFANETVPKPATKGHTLTATERITDYIANKDTYSEAWSRAQDYLRDKYSGDPQMLSALESFTNSTIGFRGTPLSSDQIMLKALAEAAIKSGEVGKTLRAQNALGMTGMYTLVADKLIQATGATGTDAEIIRSAAYDAMQSSISQIEGKMENAGQTQETVIQSEVNSIMRDIGLTLSQTAAMDGGKKSTAAEAVSAMLAYKYGFGEMDTSNVADTVQDVFAKMVDEAATKKLTSMFGEKSAPQIREYMDQVNELVNLGAFEKSQFAAAASEKLFGYKDITVDPDLMKAYKEALDSGDETAAQKAWVDIEKNVAAQMPSSWVEKLNAWRYLAMLGNPRTHVRNIMGNAGFMPVRMMKNCIAASMERVYYGKAGENSGRTKAALNPMSADDRQLLQVAWSEYSEVKDLIQSGGKFNDNASKINNMKTVFNIKPLEAGRKANNYALDAEDTWFSHPAYAESLASYLKANGISASDYADGNIGAEAKNKAQTYAIKEAQKATYRDTNLFSETISKAGKSKSKVLNTLVEGVLPFKKTPANILARGIEYSPIELVKALSYDAA